MSDQQKTNFVSDIVLKAMAGAITVLLGIAVSSLQNMSHEIKELSANVYDLSAQSKVLIVNLADLERRMNKLEQDIEKIKEKAIHKERP